METIYRERSGGVWVFWTYVDGMRVWIGAAQVERMRKQGARLVTTR